ncbi:MAG: hypothetical protein HY558_07015, partial [Euryarchaeota archaeon]|nr:hypothetical protein [Euryarchaeota archaeon]
MLVLAAGARGATGAGVATNASVALADNLRIEMFTVTPGGPTRGQTVSFGWSLKNVGNNGSVNATSNLTVTDPQGVAVFTTTFTSTGIPQGGYGNISSVACSSCTALVGAYTAVVVASYAGKTTSGILNYTVSAPPPGG